MNIHNFYRNNGLIYFIKNILNKNNYNFISNTDTDGNISAKEQHVTINNTTSYNYKYLFKELLNNEFIWIYLHGSYGDNTTTMFSDIDDLIIIDTTHISRDNIINIKRSLQKTDMRFCRIDFLQHHGHWIITKQSLTNYDSSYMPLDVLKNCQIITGPESIRYKVDIPKTSRGLKKNIIRTIENIKTLYDDYEMGKINIYNLKRLVGSYVLIPPMLLQFNGEEISKYHAIKKANEIFSHEAMACIRWSTHCRDNWSKIQENIKVRLFRLVPFVYRNPFQYRKFAQNYSPVIDLKKVGFNTLTKSCHELFCAETLSSINYEI